MKIIVSATGLLVVAGACLVLAAGNPPQQAANTAPAQQAPAGGAAPAQRPVGGSPEEQAIVQGVDAFAKAFSAANAEALSGMFIDDGEVIDPEGQERRGQHGPWGAGIAGRAARGSTNRKATCGPLPRSLDHAVQGCQPAPLFTPSTVRGGGKQRVCCWREFRPCEIM